MAAGKKEAARTRKTRSAASKSKAKRIDRPAAGKDSEAANEISPLEVMLGAMRELWARAEALRGKPECEEERLALVRQASGEAHKAAVYIHPRIASAEIEAKGAASAGRRGPVIGSRELARRLLFAVATAERSPMERGGAEKSKAGKSEKEKT